MKRQVAVSFEDDLIRVVYARQDKGSLAVEKTIVLNNEDFDSFLKKNKMPNITVVYPFRKFYSDVFPAPPVKKAYLDTIVQAEIRKRFPELNSFSFFYTALADKSPEEKGARDVFFFVVDNAEIDAIIERFDRHGKKIHIICPDIVALSNVFRLQDTKTSKTVLCLLASNADKSLFLVKNGYIRFIRVTQSAGKDLQAADIVNINMTVSYCQQQLRLNPEQLVLLNGIIRDDQDKPIIPTIQLTSHEKVVLPEDTFRDFITPLAAIISGEILKDENLLPKKYKTIYVQRLAVTYSILFFLLLSFIGIGFLLVNLAEISSLRGKIEALRKDITGTDAVIARYDKSFSELQQMLPLITHINDARSGTGIEETLMTLSFLPMENVDIQGIQINNGKDSLQMQISGTIKANNYGNMYNTFLKLINSFHKYSGATILSQKIDLKNGQFQIEVRHKAR